MTDKRGWRRLLRVAFTKRHAAELVDDELRFHTESLVERLVAEGKSEDEARRDVMKRFDSYQRTRTAMKRQVGRRVFTPGWRLMLDGLGQDIRVGWRQYTRRPGFATMTVLTLGLGIGASTTMFSVVNGVLLDPLPYPNSDRLVYIATTAGGHQYASTTAPEFMHLRDRTRSLERLVAFRRAIFDVQLPTGPERFAVADVTEDYFDVFGIAPLQGRAFTADDYRADASPVALLSHTAWQRHWGGDPGVLGTVVTGTRRLVSERESYTVIGIVPPDSTSAADILTPIRIEGTEWESDIHFANFIFRSVGRLRPGSSIDEVRVEAATVSAALAARHPTQYSGRWRDGRNLSVTHLLDEVVDDYRSSILVLFGATMVLFAIALANVSGLLLARALDQRQEMAMRWALGAGRFRIFRLLVTETTTLSLLGSGLGFFISYLCVRLLQTLGPTQLPRLGNLTPDLRVVSFAVGIALVSGVICAFVSMPSASRSGRGPIAGGTERAGGPKDPARLRGFLVTAQVALAVVLLVGAGLLSKSLLELQDVDPGIDVDGLFVMPIMPTGLDLRGGDATVEAYTTFFGDVVRKIRSIPGVASASWAPDLPLYGRQMSAPAHPEETVEDETSPVMGFHPVGPNYFETTGLPVLSGRGITWEDDAANVRVAVVNEVAAEQLWPSRDPLGRNIHIWGTWFNVVGVVGRVHYGLSGDAEPEIYVPAMQETRLNLQQRVVVRSSLPLESLAPSLRQAVWEVNPTIPVPNMEAIEDRYSVVLQEPRFYVVLMSAFSLAALLLTLAGIYGLMSYWLSMRTSEVGIRMALGARAGHVLWLVSRQALLLLLVGLAVGLGLAAASSRLLDAILFAVSTLDLQTFGVVAGGVAAIALLACLVPAARVTRTDPAKALRCE